MANASPRWMLPGPFIPYLIVMREEAASNATARRVSAEVALLQLDNWIAIRGDVLQDMELALREPASPSIKEPPVPLSCKRGMDQQLKSRITALMQASRLVVLEAPPAPKEPASSSSAPRPVQATRRVSYTFDFTSSSTLRLPYAVAIDGEVVEHARHPGLIRHNQAFTVEVPVNSTVSLYLNSDAHPGHRQNPVYGVSPRERDVAVLITEKKSTKDDPSEVPRFKQLTGPKGQEREEYTALLTGGSWMKVSYRYTEEDAKSHLPPTTDAGIREAVLSVYRAEGLKPSEKELTATCTVPVQRDKKIESETRSVTLLLEGANNPNQNIKDFVLQRDGLTRVHPKAFLVIFEAALKTGIRQLTLTSNWRPLMGSIAHRAGLGVDIGSLWVDDKNEVTLNREALRDATAATTWVSAKEKQTYDAYIQARGKVDAATQQLKSAEKAASAAETTYSKASAARVRLKKDSDKLEASLAEESKARKDFETASGDVKQFTKVKQDALEQQDAARATWSKEIEPDDPAPVKRFRDALNVHPMVGQLYDPWYMDDRTGDKTAASPNDQCDLNGQIHANHLHITLREPDLLEV